MGKQKQTKEEKLIELVKNFHEQLDLMTDIISDIPSVDQGELKIFRKRFKRDLKLIGKI